VSTHLFVKNYNGTQKKKKKKRKVSTSPFVRLYSFMAAGRSLYLHNLVGMNLAIMCRELVLNPNNYVLHSVLSRTDTKLSAKKLNPTLSLAMRRRYPIATLPFWCCQRSPTSQHGQFHPSASPHPLSKETLYNSCPTVAVTPAE
jgi:hypothetical protein